MLCPACGQEPRPPVERRPHADFCGPCWSEVGPDNPRHRGPRPRALAPREVGDYRPIPGWPWYEIDSGLCVRAMPRPGVRRVARRIAVSHGHAAPTYALRRDGKQHYIRAAELYRLAFGREWEASNQGKG